MASSKIVLVYMLAVCSHGAYCMCGARSWYFMVTSRLWWPVPLKCCSLRGLYILQEDDFGWSLCGAFLFLIKFRRLHWSFLAKFNRPASLMIKWINKALMTTYLPVVKDRIHQFIRLNNTAGKFSQQAQCKTLVLATDERGNAKSRWQHAELGRSQFSSSLWRRSSA